MQMLKGDLIHLALAGEFDLIIHGCNCFCTMDAGIARAVRETFPAAYQADLDTRSGERSKLGFYSMASVPLQGKTLTIINGYTQYHYAGEGILADYGAIDSLFARIKRDFSGKKMGYPKIGAGLARGNWDKIQTIIENQLEGETHTLVEYVKQRKASS